ncbi:MAG TPA: ATP synthase F0 subunit B [Candidatus Acidoferrum sp.]|nr:ATP synthase F0 subunit B [Candidatus Acidoferrum sp.]
MQDLLRQLGDLVLQAAPTVLIILIFYFIMRAIFFKPLLKTMAERDSRTVGAQKSAEAAQAAASEKEKQYQDALKHARAKIYAEQEVARKKLLDARTEQLKQARAEAGAKISKAKDRIAGEFAAARRDVESTVAQLSAEIAGRILPSQPRRPGGSAREAQ